MRKKLKLSNDRVDESINDKNLFKAVFLAGGPGSGKSFVAENMFLSRTGISPLGVKVINSDKFFELGLEKADLPKIIDMSNIEQYQKQMVVRGNAQIKTKLQQGYFIDGMLPLIVDGTGKDFKKISEQAKILYSTGYDVSMVFINTSLDVALERNNKRERKVDANLVVQMWNQVQSNIGRFQAYFGSKNFYIVDNNSYFEEGSREAKEFFDYLFKVGNKLITSSLENLQGKRILKLLKDIGGRYLSDLLEGKDFNLDKKQEKFLKILKENIILAEENIIEVLDSIKIAQNGYDIILEKGDKIKIISENYNTVTPRLAQEIQKIGKFQRQGGGKVDIDYGYNTLSVTLRNGFSYFYRGQDAWNILDEIPDNVSEEDYIFWIAQKW